MDEDRELVAQLGYLRPKPRARIVNIIQALPGWRAWYIDVEDRDHGDVFGPRQIPVIAWALMEELRHEGEWRAPKKRTVANTIVRGLVPFNGENVDDAERVRFPTFFGGYVEPVNETPDHGLVTMVKDYAGSERNRIYTAMAQARRCRFVANDYPRVVAHAYNGQLERAAKHTDGEIAATVAEWERSTGIEPRDWIAIGQQEREGSDA
jgi:hypothetical protein